MEFRKLESRLAPRSAAADGGDAGAFLKTENKMKYFYFRLLLYPYIETKLNDKYTS